MATIREDLVIGGNFAQVFSSYLNLGRQMAANMHVVTETQNGFTAAAAQSEKALEEMAGAGGRTREILEEISNTLHDMASGSDDAAREQDRLNRTMRNGASVADSLTQKVMGLATAYVGLRSAQKLISLSDTWTQTTARLERMNDGQWATSDMQDAIFQVAQRTRGNY
ncbi:MAG: hypothetical protein K2N78_01540 [Oscillospiraceae bacterium]|nr:hypothetical protein [Oscillospiraceae bacterium]